MSCAVWANQFEMFQASSFFKLTQSGSLIATRLAIFCIRFLFACNVSFLGGLGGIMDFHCLSSLQICPKDIFRKIAINFFMNYGSLRGLIFVCFEVIIKLSKD